MRIILAFLLMLPLGLHAQSEQKLNIELRKVLKEKSADESIDLFLRGDAQGISAFVNANDGIVKKRLDNIISCTLPVQAVYQLNSLEGLDFVEFSNSQPHMLNDLMLVNNNIHPIHQGQAPLESPYFGEDVILGFVDSGIELNHGDFQHEDGSTRIIALWDHTQEEVDEFRVPQPYGYGQEWTAEDIDAGITGHDDQANFYGHGSTVTGVGAGNGNATGDFPGVAQQADIIMVSSDFTRENWTSSIADAVDFIFAKADALGKPAVVNLSLGTYYGSHDGLDAAALLMDDLLEGSTGRSIVAAAGNSGNWGNYHLSYDVPQQDTAFTWFEYNNDAGAVLFEFWADTLDFENTQFTIGADLTVPEYEFRGYAGWRNAEMNLDQSIIDTIFFDGQILGIVETWVGLRDAQYYFQVQVTEPFSNQYLWRLSTTGGGTFDCWSYAPFGTSKIVEDFPDGGIPGIEHYEYPDNQKTIVDSWVCSDKVITVGNYTNRDAFDNYLGEVTTYDVTPGEISINCSRGPTRDNRQKPTISATGDNILSAGRIATLNSFITNSPHKVAASGMHYINGGTSMASPVVAAVAALFYEKNEGADYQDVITAIIDNALADQFTGVLPGDQYGHGKLNGFGTLTAPFGPNSVSNVEGQALEIYPNPAQQSVFVKLNGSATTVRITDLTGRLVRQYQLLQSTNETRALDLRGLTNGLYLITATEESGNRISTKLIIEN